MKNILNSILLIVSALILFSSCRMGMTKRHYMKGYYVQHVAKKTHPKAEDVKQSPALAVEQEQAIASIPADKKTSIVNETLTYQQTEIASVKTRRTVPAFFRAAKNFTSAHLPDLSLKNRLFTARSQKSFESSDTGTDSASDDARSWLWTIALAVFLIWLIGLLFGVGGDWVLVSAINILFLIAVVLFILWIFRII